MVAVVASQAGRPTNPAWFYNLVAHPETTLQLVSEVRAVRARVARDEERECLWPNLSAVYPGYDFFQRLAERRKIPVAILEPRDATSHPTKESGEHGRNRRLARCGGGLPNGDPLRAEGAIRPGPRSGSRGGVRLREPVLGQLAAVGLAEPVLLVRDAARGLQERRHLRVAR